MTADAVIFPQTFGGFPPCSTCFGRPDSLATAVDPRSGALALLCGPCCAALNEGRPIALPTGEELGDRWESLACLHQNKEIGDEVVAVALETLAPNLSPEEGTDAFELLKEMLIRLQHLSSDMADPAAYEGGLEYAELAADADRRHALKTLTGGRS